MASTTCTVCGSADVTEMPLTILDDRPFTFVSCHACESNRWVDESGAVWRREDVFKDSSR